MKHVLELTAHLMCGADWRLVAEYSMVLAHKHQEQRVLGADFIAEL